MLSKPFQKLKDIAKGTKEHKSNTQYQQWDTQQSSFQINETDDQRSESFVESEESDDDAGGFTGNPGPPQLGTSNSQNSYSQFPDLT